MNLVAHFKVERPASGVRRLNAQRSTLAGALLSPAPVREAFTLLVFLAFTASAAPLRLDPLYASDMVLPCGAPFVVTGEAAPNEEVAVRFGALPEARARADARGRWRATLPAAPASAQPRDLVVRASRESLVCTNVLAGDLWLCAGQSNMAFPLASCDGGAAAAAATDPNLRLLHLACRLPTDNRPWNESQLAVASSTEPFHISWCGVSPRSAPPLSGVAVLFGQALRRARPGVPLGLIQLAVGGAPVEAFLPAPEGARPTWLDDPAFPAPWCQTRAKVNLKNAHSASGQAPARHPYEPGLLYDCGVAPLTALPVAGVLWYQGESNATTGGTPDVALDAAVMRAGLTSLIASWRRAWARDDMPFVLIQLPRMNRPWMLYREQQALVAQALPRVGLVVTTDTGNPANVHPTDKAAVAQRAAGEALRVAYRDPQAPAFTFAASAAGADTVVVRFTPGHRLAVRGGALAGFELSADGQTFTPAQAALRPDHTVALAAGAVSSPVEVRYNWSPVPLGNLYNSDDLPVAPFRLRLSAQPSEPLNLSNRKPYEP